MSLRVPRVSQLFDSIVAETPSSIRDRARTLSAEFAETRSALPLAPGDVAGNYEVVEVLGAGGQAVVYRAKHRQIGRHVALKVPRREVGDRLLKEAQLAARLEHPSIVRVEDIQLEGAVPFMVLEHCEKGSLDDLLDQAPHGLDMDSVRAIAESILRALAFAHEEGIVHRDVKPANILFDKNGTPKVADFGIGTMSRADGLSVSIELSQLSMLAGTPLYVAPEQENPALRANGRLDGRADLFSFGKVLFQMLTGASPRTIRPPSRLRKGLDPAWDDFVFKLLEERPEDRFASATAALHALPHGPGHHVAAAPPAPKPPVVVVARTSPPPTPPREAGGGLGGGSSSETPWQEQARFSCNVFAVLYMVGTWFAVGAMFVSHEQFLPTIYAVAFASAASFCIAEGKRAGRAKNPTASAILAACVGGGLVFVGSAAGIHFALESGPKEASVATLFATLPIQALGYFLAWIGHKGLEPFAEHAATRRELMLVEGLLATLEVLLCGLAAYVTAKSLNPTSIVPILVTLSIGTTLAFLHVFRLRWKRGERWF